MAADVAPYRGRRARISGKGKLCPCLGDGRTSTVSFWDDEASLASWTRNPRHREAMAEGKAGIFSHYDIRICSELRHYVHEAV